ncbi:GGDEF domain-containing protein [Vibrio sp. Of7-15]|uniref:sensor domain-containing diguanylate cyclase n=1 Tax=Vibrio sp. Of7-15 TaxID=2724879 RepID=UPI001EF281E7|nr:sensor domain-containing diguanylate cyclase [Vibrio sp. Of7-15]MCG7499200.1 GGDEF domain-containing protein [Vibrio sp. Of7-15]
MLKIDNLASEMDFKDRYFTVLDSLPDHIFVFSESGSYVDVYGGEENETGFDCKSFIGRSLYEVSPPDMAKKFHAYIRAALESNKIQVIKYKFDKQEMIDLPDHVSTPMEIWFEGIIKPLTLIENNERTVVWMAKNITERHYLEQRLKTLSEIDELTGIYNRRSFTSSLSKSLERFHSEQRSFSLLMIDIDRFKRINDSIGHSSGDDVINHVVSIFQSELAPTHCIGRLGGEEFSVILDGTTPLNALCVAEKIRAKIEKSPCKTGEYTVQATVSIGVTGVLKNDDDIKNLLSRADKAMYHSKTSGRNRVSLYTEDIERNNRRSTDGIQILNDTT